MSYRWATPADAGELARLNQQLIRDGADFGPDDLEFLIRRMRDWLAHGGYRAVLFTDEAGNTVAYALFRDAAEEIYLAQFLVVRDARGHGIGQAAIALLRSEIWQQRKRLTLDVLIGNRAALEFWHQLGWRDCALTLEIPLGGEAAVASVACVAATAESSRSQAA